MQAGLPIRSQLCVALRSRGLQPGRAALHAGATARRTSIRPRSSTHGTSCVVVGEYYWDGEVFPQRGDLGHGRRRVCARPASTPPTKGLEVVVELEPFETSLAKDVHELVRFVRDVDHPAVRANADISHLHLSGASFDDVEGADGPHRPHPPLRLRRQGARRPAGRQGVTPIAEYLAGDRRHRVRGHRLDRARVLARSRARSSPGSRRRTRERRRSCATSACGREAKSDAHARRRGRGRHRRRQGHRRGGRAGACGGGRPRRRDEPARRDAERVAASLGAGHLGLGARRALDAPPWTRPRPRRSRGLGTPTILVNNAGVNRHRPVRVVPGRGLGARARRQPDRRLPVLPRRSARACSKPGAARSSTSPRSSAPQVGMPGRAPYGVEQGRRRRAHADARRRVGRPRRPRQRTPPGPGAHADGGRCDRARDRRRAARSSTTRLPARLGAARGHRRRRRRCSPPRRGLRHGPVARRRRRLLDVRRRPPASDDRRRFGRRGSSCLSSSAGSWSRRELSAACRSPRAGRGRPARHARRRRRPRRPRARVPHRHRLRVRRPRRPRLRHRTLRAARRPARVDVGRRRGGPLVLRARRARLLPHLRRRAARHLRDRAQPVHGGGHGGAVPLPAQADRELRPARQDLEPAGPARRLRGALGRRRVHARRRGRDAGGDRVRRAARAAQADRGPGRRVAPAASTTWSRTSGTTSPRTCCSTTSTPASRSWTRAPRSSSRRPGSPRAAITRWRATGS